jgi:hypothetical protein
MKCAAAALACLSLSVLHASPQAAPAPPSFGFDQAYHHELKPHRNTIPVKDFHSGDDQIGLVLIVSSSGDVVSATANGDANTRSYWPTVKEEVLSWKFDPFLVDGRPVTAKVEEYVDLVPPERLPTTRVTPPVIRPNSHVTISLKRSMCYGQCPAYSVTVSAKGVVFDGEKYVAIPGKHTASVDPIAVRALAARFIAADFYSMEPNYHASVTDNAGYRLSISIDGHKKQVDDYVGQRVGMPAVIKDLEDAVDELAGTKRWIKGSAESPAALQ